MRVVIAAGSFGGSLGAAAATDAIAAGWGRAAPHDDLVLAPGPHLGGLDAALAGAGLVITGEGSFDWESLRGPLVPAVARSAGAHGVPCVVLAGQVLVGRREAAAVGVDAAYAIADDAGDVDTSTADPPGALAALAEKVARRWSR